MNSFEDLNNDDLETEEQPAQVERQGKLRWVRWLLAGAAVIAIVVAGFAFWSRIDTRPADTAYQADGQSYPADGQLYLPDGKATMGDDPVLGPPNAPVVITEYGDFGCPPCRLWHQSGMMDKIMTDYGFQVTFVWKDLAVISPQSMKAAEAGQCAHDQRAFWEYHDYLYDSDSGLSVDDLKAAASEIDLDTEQFDQCLESGKHREKIIADIQDAEKLDLIYVPSFYVNDQLLVGPPSYKQLRDAIDKALGNQGG